MNKPVTISTESMIQMACNMGVPRHMAAQLTAYVQARRPPTSDFLMAVLMNDLKLAVKRADHLNVQALPAYVEFLITWGPVDCWGSEDHFHEWVDPYLRARNQLIEGLVSWSNGDQARARLEGWECKPDHDFDKDDKARVVRYFPPPGDETMIDTNLNFADDKAALEYVIKRAVQGSALHARALTAIGDDARRHEPKAL